MNESVPHHAEHELPDSDSEGAASRWRRSFTWLTLLAIGWVLYELTARPALGSVVVCLKFGWEDLRTAIWLRRRDPYHMRGRACFWLHQASGMFRIASVAGLMSIAFTVLSYTFPARGQAAPWADLLEILGWTALTTFVGMVCSALSIGYAAALGRCAGIKLWLSSDTHRARQSGLWPPYCPNGRLPNRFAFLTEMVLSLIGIPLSLILFVAFLLLVVNRNPDLINIGLAMLVFFLVMVGGPLLMLWGRDQIHNRLTARHPTECWRLADEPAFDIESMASASSDQVM